MTNNESKIYVCEWDKNSNMEYDIKVTPHSSAESALEQANTSTAQQHCIGTVNPIAGEGEDKK